MARLNIETSINKEHAFQELLIKTGDRKKAKGCCWELWELAQEYWFPERRLIPEEIFKKADLEVMVEVGLAERRPNGIYAKGSEKLFQWLFDKAEAGKASAVARKKKNGSAQPKRKKTPEQRSNSVRTVLNSPEGTSTSLLSSLSSSLFSPSSEFSAPGVENCAENGAAPDIQPALMKIDEGVQINGVGEFLAIRRRLHLEIHEVEPVENAQVNGILSRIAKSIPRSEVPKALEYFYKVPNNFYKTRGHDLKLLLGDIHKIVTEVRRRAPIIPDAQATKFQKTLNAISRDEELQRMLKAKQGGVA